MNRLIQLSPGVLRVDNDTTKKTAYSQWLLWLKPNPCLGEARSAVDKVPDFKSSFPPFQMYGRYQRDLSEAAREEARRLRRLRKKRRKDDRLRQKELEANGKPRARGKFFKVLGKKCRS